MLKKFTFIQEERKLSRMKKIGIWGFGAVGKSAYEYFKGRAAISILNGSLIEGMPQVIAQDEKTIKQFLDDNDLIIASPGIDTSSYQPFHHKFVAELDILRQQFKKPIIAITGTIGKTTITKLLSDILVKKTAIFTGGNIGHAMLNCLTDENEYDTAVIEVSSFQLEYARAAAPDLAIISNIYPNHLDRHASFAAYQAAKYNLVTTQRNGQHALIPIEIAPALLEKNPKSVVALFSAQQPSQQEKERYQAHAIYWLNGVSIQCTHHHTTTTIIEAIPSWGFVKNWLTIAAALHLLDEDTSLLLGINEPKGDAELEHRLEECGSFSGTTFINDSKSTIMESTIAAVAKYTDKKTTLLLGGLSKGVDRTPYIAQLKNSVTQVICFGAEADQLAQACALNNLPHIQAVNLEDAFSAAIGQAENTTTILLSPGGASFDLFANYKERGNRFKELVKRIDESC